MQVQTGRGFAVLPLLSGPQGPVVVRVDTCRVRTDQHKVRDGVDIFFKTSGLWIYIYIFNMIRSQKKPGQPGLFRGDGVQMCSER